MFIVGRFLMYCVNFWNCVSSLAVSENCLCSWFLIYPCLVCLKAAECWRSSVHCQHNSNMGLNDLPLFERQVFVFFFNFLWLLLCSVVLWPGSWLHTDIILREGPRLEQLTLCSFDKKKSKPQPQCFILPQRITILSPGYMSFSSTLEETNFYEWLFWR